MYSTHVQIGKVLGEQIVSQEDVLRVVELRLAPSAIQLLIDNGLERAEIDDIVIPSRTLQHRRSRQERLTIEESDRVVRVIRAISQAEAVYASHERALAWLRRPNPRLDGRTPFSLLNTDIGSRIVEEMLVQIDEGMFV